MFDNLVVPMKPKLPQLSSGIANKPKCLTHIDLQGIGSIQTLTEALHAADGGFNRRLHAVEKGNFALMVLWHT